LSAFSVDALTGALSLLPGSPFATGGSWSEVVVGTTGRFVYVADGWGGSIHVFELTPEGNLGEIADLPGPDLPFGVAVSPSGRYLYAYDGMSQGTAVYGIDATSGQASFSTASTHSAQRPCGRE
jgi:6-phosphogluconolactonase